MDLVPVNPAEPHVTAIGQFAVDEENKKRPTNKLNFVAVVGGYHGPVTGATRYPLILGTQDGKGHTFLHKALVHEKPDGSLELKGYWE